MLGGFKEMKRAKFDKEIIERVFDEQYIERQKERIRQQYQTQSQYFALSKQNAAQQMQPGTFITTSTNTGGGLMGAIGLGGIFK